MTDSPKKPLATHYPCNVCGKVAIGCYRPDMDIKGLCFCAEHKNEVSTVYTAINSFDPKDIERLIKDWKFK